MGWTLEVASNAAASSWTDVTALVDRHTLRVGGECSGGGTAGTGFGFDFADDVAAYEFPARRVVRFTIGSTVCGRGRVAVKDLARGTIWSGDARQFAVNFTDGNAHLQGIPVHGWARPAETDVARIMALCSEFLAGSPRASTDLATTYLSSDGPVDLEAKTYDNTNPAGVVAEVERIAGKLFFVTVDDEVFYDRVDSSNYNAGLSVTDVSPDLATEFPPIADGPIATQDGSELYSGLGLTYSDPPQTIYATDAAVETAHDYWQEVVNSEGATTVEQAAAELASLLEFRKVEEDRFQFAIRLTEAQVGLVKYGQNISFRSAAAGILSPITIRIARLVWEEYAPGIWLAHIENAKLSPRLARGARVASRVPYQPPLNAGVTGNWIDPATADVPPFAADYPAFVTNSGGGSGSQLIFNTLLADNPQGMTYQLSGSLDTWELHATMSFTPHPDDTGLALFYVAIAGAAQYNALKFIPFDVDFGAGVHGREEVTPGFWTVFPLTGLVYLKVRRIEIPNTGTHKSQIKLWPAVSPGYEPNWTDYAIDIGGAKEFTFFLSPDSGSWTDIDISVTGVQVTTASTSGPAIGQAVPMSLVGISDGSTTDYTTAYPYAPGSLRVEVDRLNWTNEVIETNPATGEWAFTTAPATGDTIMVGYVGGAT